ncbi:MAG: alkaline phosphatase [Candidatus Riflebacteria bacterium]|nr:alkaline phosphatase [Candidatus Riflebacteria bacterium]
MFKKYFFLSAIVLFLIFSASDFIFAQQLLPHESETTKVQPEQLKTDLITPLNDNPVPIDKALEKKFFFVKKPVKGVILLITDGMNSGSIKFARELIVGREGLLEIDKMPVVGRVIGNPVDGPVHDSAAAGTCLATGRQTKNDRISVSPENEKYQTLWEMAKKIGLKVGLITTARITHATPAVFAAHVENRDSEDEIAEQLVRSDFDFMMGGGKRHFVASKRKDGKDLIGEAVKEGYEIISDRKEMVKVTSQERKKILGLFADSHFDHSYMENKTQPALSEMTAAGLKFLGSGKDRFLLMVESSAIDVALHYHDPVELLAQMRNFNETLGLLREFVIHNSDVLLVVASDHGTSGITIGEVFDPEKFLKIATSTTRIAYEFLSKPDQLGDFLNKNFGSVLQLDQEKILKMKQLKEPMHLSAAIGDLLFKKFGILYSPYEEIFNSPVTDGHTGEDLFIHAMGFHQNLFGGVMRIQEIPSRLAIALGWKFP